MLKVDEKALTTAQDDHDSALLETLRVLGGQRVADDDLAFEGTRFILPATMSPQRGIDFLQAHIAAQEERTMFQRVFPYRPWDGGFAVQSALKKLFGSTGRGKATRDFFGNRVSPPVISIRVGVDEEAQIPWGQVEFPLLEATLHFGGVNDPERGALFRLAIEAPKRFSGHVEGLFTAVKRELEGHSIYRGKAFDGAGEANFIDPYSVRSEDVVYTAEVRAQLEANVWSLLRHTQTMRDLRVPLKRSVLIEGPYGTGKSLSAMLTAQIANENGWSFVFCRPGRDDLKTTMQTAALYQPAVVFFEDVDTVSSDGDVDKVSELLDLFDGITAKGTEIVVVMTTNHPERIHKGMLRPGRMDAVIHIGALDGQGVEEMVRAAVPRDLLSDDIDWDRVGKSNEGYLPAFVRESIDRAMRYGISRSGGLPEVLTTEDFVLAADGLRPQLELMESAGHGVPPEPLAVALRREVVDAVSETVILDSDGDARWFLMGSESEYHERTARANEVFSS